MEGIARIWFEMWKAYAKNGLVIEVEDIDYVTGQKNVRIEKVENYILEALKTSVKVDITPKGSFDKYAQELSIENMFIQGKITFEEYVEALDTDSVMPKSKLETILKKRKAAQDKIKELEMQGQMIKQQAIQKSANAMDIQNIATQGNQLINQYLDNQATI